MTACSTPDCARKPESGRSRCRTCRRAGKAIRPIISPMKVLLIDIETTPNLAWTWGLFNQNISLNQLVKPTKMLCFAAKWLGDSKTMFFSEREDGQREMVEAAWRLLHEADAVMHYNGARFDVPHLNREFILHGLGPPAPYAQIDLLKTVRTQFRFTSNKLQHVSTQLGLEGKVGHEGFDLWTKCMDGDAKAWSAMKKYNIQDVILLEDLYRCLLPWITTHPNVNLYGGSGCPKCGSDAINRIGTARTQQRAFPQFLCFACGSWLRSTRREQGAAIVAVAA